MKRLSLILLVAIAGCDTGAPDGGERDRASAPVQTAELTGLYEGQAQAGQPARMCMVPGESGTTSFGIVSWGPQGGACSGAGEAARQGDVLRLAMAGDEECVIEARIADRQVTFPASLPEGCAYYCSAGATLAGERFEKTGGTAEAAMAALDLAGDPLCG